MDSKSNIKADPISEIARIACELTGVQLNERHHEMIRSRLTKRLSELSLKSIQEYLDYFNNHRDTESPKLVGLMTTHHTYFFREYSHFEFILQFSLPKLLNELRQRPDRTLRVWSAACSRGQEAYSLAMFLELHLKRLDPTLKYIIHGTDIDSESVEIAKNAVYLRQELKEVPAPLLANHWVRGTGNIENYVKARKELREHCTFSTGNLLELNPIKEPKGPFDLIFCRNVFIYFNQEQIKTITHSLLHRLAKNGYLFVGISESLSQLKLPLANLGPSVYQHKNTVLEATQEKLAKIAAPSISPLSTTPVPTPPATIAPIRVLCVDDSGSILILLKKILTKESGFEIVGTAENGIQAHQKCQELKPDVMTLDIHMPEMTGIEYLQKHFNQNHPPVLMLTSVSRENAELAGKALQLGASDYIEKPALSNISEKSDEIRTKIKCALQAKSLNHAVNHSLDRSFLTKKTAIDANQTLRVAIMSLSHRQKLKQFLNENIGTSQPPLFLATEGNSDVFQSLADQLSQEFGKKVNYVTDSNFTPQASGIYLFNISQMQSFYESFGKKRRTSILVYGEQSKVACERILQWNGAQLILEEVSKGKGTLHLTDVANYIVPSTSFEFHSSDFLSSSTPKPGEAA